MCRYLEAVHRIFSTQESAHATAPYLLCRRCPTTSTPRHMTVRTFCRATKMASWLRRLPAKLRIPLASPFPINPSDGRIMYLLSPMALVRNVAKDECRYFYTKSELIDSVPMIQRDPVLVYFVLGMVWSVYGWDQRFADSRKLASAVGAVTTRLATRAPVWKTRWRISILVPGLPRFLLQLITIETTPNSLSSARVKCLEPYQKPQDLTILTAPIILLSLVILKTSP